MLLLIIVMLYICFTFIEIESRCWFPNWGVDQTEFDGTDSRSGSVCWACCGKEHRNDDAEVDDDDDDDEDDIRVEVGTEKLAIVSGNSDGIWTRRAIKIFTGLVKSRTLWLTEDENINESAETREICALATYVIAYNFYRTTANQQGVKTRPHPAIRRGAKGRNENEHCIQSICGVPPSLSLSLLFFLLPFRLENFCQANVSRQINKLLILLRCEQLPNENTPR